MSICYSFIPSWLEKLYLGTWLKVCIWIYIFKSMPTNKEHLTVGSLSGWLVLVKGQKNLLQDNFQGHMYCHVPLDYWTCLLHGHLTTVIIGALWSEYGEGWLRKKGYVEVKQNIIYGKKATQLDWWGRWRWKLLHQKPKQA